MTVSLKDRAMKRALVSGILGFAIVCLPGYMLLFGGPIAPLQSLFLLLGPGGIVGVLLRLHTHDTPFYYCMVIGSWIFYSALFYVLFWWRHAHQRHEERYEK